MKCPNCNNENPDGNMFCDLCGTRLSTVSSSSTSRKSTLRTSLDEMEAAMNAKLDAFMGISPAPAAAPEPAVKAPAQSAAPVAQTGTPKAKYLIPEDYFATERGSHTTHCNVVTIRNLDDTPNPELTKVIADFCRRNWPDFDSKFTVEEEDGIIYSPWGGYREGLVPNFDDEGFFKLSSMTADWDDGFDAAENFEENWDYIRHNFSFDPDDGFDPEEMDIEDREEKYKIRVTAASKCLDEVSMERLGPGYIWDIDDCFTYYLKNWGAYFEDLAAGDNSLYNWYELDNLPSGDAKIAGYIDGDHIYSPDNSDEYAAIPPEGWNNLENLDDATHYVTTDDLYNVSLAEDYDFYFVPEDEIED